MTVREYEIALIKGDLKAIKTFEDGRFLELLGYTYKRQLALLGVISQLITAYDYQGLDSQEILKGEIFDPSEDPLYNWELIHRKAGILRKHPEQLPYEVYGFIFEKIEPEQEGMLVINGNLYEGTPYEIAKQISVLPVMLGKENTQREKEGNTQKAKEGKLEEKLEKVLEDSFNGVFNLALDNYPFKNYIVGNCLLLVTLASATKEEDIKKAKEAVSKHVCSIEVLRCLPKEVIQKLGLH